MSASFYDLLKFAKTGIASPDMTHYDKMKALAMCKAGFPVKTLTGVPPISFKSDGTPLIAWTVVGNERQTGTPTPTVPIQPQECGDKTEQLFDSESATVENAYINVTDSRWKSSIDSRSVKIACEPNTTYTISTANSYPIFRVAESNIINAAPQVSGSGTSTLTVLFNGANENHATFTTGQDAKWIIFQASASAAEEWINDIMLNTGSTALPYEPYGYKIPITNGNTTYNIYLTEPLRKIGDYGDTVASDGTVTRRVKKLVLTGEETFFSESELYGTYLSTQYITYANWSQSFCTHFTYADSYSACNVNTQGNGKFGISNRSSLFVIWINSKAGSTTWDTADEMKSYLAQQYAAGTPVTVWYVLATATTETVTVPTLTPTKGSNTLSIGTTLAPSSVSITGGIK